jgi:hypothetical protein
MNQRTDIERVLDRWLAEGPTRVPDRVFDDAIARVARQSQPSPWRSRWRTSDMTTPLRLLAAAAAVIAIIGVGLLVLRPTSSVGPRPIPTATLLASPSSLPRPTSSVSDAARLPIGGELEPGRYFIEEGPATPTTFSFAVPAGWLGGAAGVSRHRDESGREIGFIVAVVDALFGDPCGGNAPVDAGTTAEDLVNRLTERPGLDVTPAEAIELDGRRGQTVELAAETEIDLNTCDPPIGLQVWLDQAGNYLVVGPEVVTRIHTVDVEGERFVLVANHGLSADPGEIAEIAAMIESIRFHP